MSEEDDLNKPAFQLPSNSPPVTPELFDLMLQKAVNWRARLQRANVILVVDELHEGPPEISRHPTDGISARVTYDLAREIHEIYPLGLKRIISEQEAEFETFLVGQVRVPLYPPPYILTRNEDQ